MKKSFVLLTLALFAMSCENPLEEPEPKQEVLEEARSETPDLTMTTRAASSEEADFDPLTEIVNNKIPVNILNVEN